MGAKTFDHFFYEMVILSLHFTKQQILTLIFIFLPRILFTCYLFSIPIATSLVYLLTALIEYSPIYPFSLLQISHLSNLFLKVPLE